VFGVSADSVGHFEVTASHDGLHRGPFWKGRRRLRGWYENGGARVGSVRCD
jgi:hypothetical protein